jgi:hypothetical protein
MAISASITHALLPLPGDSREPLEEEQGAATLHAMTPQMTMPWAKKHYSRAQVVFSREHCGCWQGPGLKKLAAFASASAFSLFLSSSSSSDFSCDPFNFESSSLPTPNNSLFLKHTCTNHTHIPSHRHTQAHKHTHTHTHTHTHRYSHADAQKCTYTDKQIAHKCRQALNARP